MPFAIVRTSPVSAIRDLLRDPPEGTISFGGGFPDVDLMDLEGLRASVRAASDKRPRESFQYGQTEGLRPLREKLAEHLGTKGVTEVGADNLVITTGSQQAIFLMASVTIKPGDVVLVESPTFLSAIECFRFFGAEVIGVPTDAQGVQPDKLRELVDRHKPAFFYTIPNFGNPSGATMSLDRRLEVLRIARDTRTPVIEDNPYGDLYFTESPPPSLLALSAQVPGSRNELAYCGSLSKTVSPGLRMGFLVAPAEVLSADSRLKQYADACCGSLDQVTADEYLSSGRLEPQLRVMRQEYATRAQKLCDELNATFGEAVEFVPPQGGLFVWARLTGKHGQPADALAFARLAKEHRVAFVPGVYFDPSRKDTSSFRLSFSSASLEQIHEGVRRMGEAYKALCAAAGSAPAAERDGVVRASPTPLVVMPAASGVGSAASSGLHWSSITSQAGRSMSTNTGRSSATRSMSGNVPGSGVSF